VVKPLMVDALKEVVERARKARAAMGATI
jgi:hypothetical protein